MASCSSSYSAVDLSIEQDNSYTSNDYEEADFEQTNLEVNINKLHVCTLFHSIMIYTFKQHVINIELLLILEYWM